LNESSDAVDDQSSQESLLRVVGVSKAFHGKQVTEDVHLDIPRDAIFALLGPNGAGKTTTFNIIRGDVVPDTGDVFIDGASIVTHPRRARMALGVCPQFTAIDDQLTVREHLCVYGRLKGLARGAELDDSVHAVLEGTGLAGYAERLANRLSGGNQRKLALAIALLGNPAVVLIDEFSTGVDPRMKREMWDTLRRVGVGKAIVITTRKSRLFAIRFTILIDFAFSA
jgi:ATP-binding cassette subfamily A (ABC1) protein 3